MLHADSDSRYRGCRCCLTLLGAVPLEDDFVDIGKHPDRMHTHVRVTLHVDGHVLELLVRTSTLSSRAIRTSTGVVWTLSVLAFPWLTSVQS